MGTEAKKDQEPLPPIPYSSIGTIHTYTRVIHNPAEGIQAPTNSKDQAPYYLALIDLEKGPRIFAQLTDLGDSEPVFDMRVEMVERKLQQNGDEGTIVYGYKFRPIIKEELNGKYPTS